MAASCVTSKGDTQNHQLSQFEKKMYELKGNAYAIPINGRTLFASLFGCRTELPWDKQLHCSALGLWDAGGN